MLVSNKRRPRINAAGKISLFRIDAAAFIRRNTVHSFFISSPSRGRRQGGDSGGRRRRSHLEDFLDFGEMLSKFKLISNLEFKSNLKNFIFFIFSNTSYTGSSSSSLCYLARSSFAAIRTIDCTSWPVS